MSACDPGESTPETARRIGLDIKNEAWVEIVNLLEVAWQDQPPAASWGSFREGFLCGLKAAQELMLEDS